MTPDRKTARLPCRLAVALALALAVAACGKDESKKTGGPSGDTSKDWREPMTKPAVAKRMAQDAAAAGRSLAAALANGQPADAFLGKPATFEARRVDRTPKHWTLRTVEGITIDATFVRRNEPADTKDENFRITGVARSADAAARRITLDDIDATPIAPMTDLPDPLPEKLGS